MSKKTIKNIFFTILIGNVFAVLTVIWTYPLVFNMETSIFADGDWLFDTFVAIYGTWLNKLAWLGEMKLDFNHLIGYPFGVDISNINREPVIEIPLLCLALWKNEVFAFNVIIMSSYFLSAVTMFLLAYYFTKSRIASFLAAIIYAFCPYHTLQCFSHMSLAVIQWLPLYVLCLFKFGDKPSYARSILCALVFLLVALSNYYYAYIIFIFTCIFCIVFLIKKLKHGCKDAVKFVAKISLIGLIACMVLIPLNYNAILSVFRKSGQAEDIAVVRKAPPFQDLYRYSANITDYIRPSEYHPIFGNVDFWFIKPYSAMSRHWSEKTVFLGYVVLILAFCGIIRLFKKKMEIEKIHNLNILLVSIFLTFIISLPPKIGKIPMPSFFLYWLFPMFRSYARFGIMVMLGIAVFAGFGFKYFLDRCERKSMFVCAIIGLVLFEFTVIPPSRNVDLSEIPKVYEYIKTLPNDAAIAEYPLLPETDSDHYKYLFYQIFHKHPIFNGSYAGSQGDIVRLKIRDLSDSNSATELKNLGIEYVVLHKEDYREEEIIRVKDNKSLEILAEYDDSIIYKVI